MNNEFFAPGENLNLLGISKQNNSDSQYCSFKFPIRIHATPIDCNRFSYGNPGGGGGGVCR